MSEPKPQQEPSMEEILASIRRIISEDGAAAGADAKPEQPKPEPPKADVLELTEVVEEPEEIAPESAEEPAEPAEEPAAEIELRDEEPAPEPPEMRIVPSAPQQQPQPEPAADIQGLIGPNAAAAATSALTSLVQAVDASRGGTPIGHGNRTIEDLVKDVMRPMIKDWLDTNLPRLVERLVRKEIERLSHNAEDD
jgi:cell pole-organizing protein PopZ